MSLKLYYHPLSSFCHKVLIALYEIGVAFEPVHVDLGNEQSRADFLKVWPLGKPPVLRDEARGLTVPESTTAIEYLAQHYAGNTRLIPTDPDRARETRFRDRFFDLYLHAPMFQIVGDVLRPADKRDPTGVEQAIRAIRTGYAWAEKELGRGPWAMGDDFTMADCAAAPPLFYADKIVPLGNAFPTVSAHFERMKKRPSYARTLKEAEPYLHYFPVKAPMA